MSNGLEALEKIKNWECFVDFELETNGEKEFANELSIIEKELKALEIIKPYFTFGTWDKNHVLKYKCYPKYLSQEEYELLREVLGNV